MVQKVNPKSVKLETTVSTALKAQVKRKAKQRGVSVASVIREALRRFVKN